MVRTTIFTKNEQFPIIRRINKKLDEVFTSTKIDSISAFTFLDTHTTTEPIVKVVLAALDPEIRGKSSDEKVVSDLLVVLEVLLSEEEKEFITRVDVFKNYIYKQPASSETYYYINGSYQKLPFKVVVPVGYIYAPSGPTGYNTP